RLGGGAVQHRLDVGDDGGGLLEEEPLVRGEGLEVVAARQAVPGEVADDGFDVTGEGRVVVAEEVRMGDGGLAAISTVRALITESAIREAAPGRPRVSWAFTRGRRNRVLGRVRLRWPRVPDPSRPVDPARDEAIALAAERHAINPGQVAAESEDFL